MRQVGIFVCARYSYCLECRFGGQLCSDPEPYAMAASLEVGFGGDGDSGRRQCPLAIFICGSTVRPGTVCGGVQTYAAAISSFLGDPSHP
jgi:hypothetical protein